MKIRKICVRFLIACMVPVLIYGIIWGCYWKRCDMYRDRVVEKYGMESGRIDGYRFGCRMPNFFRFNALFGMYTSNDNTEYSENHVERYEIPQLFFFPGVFKGFVVASEAPEAYVVGADENGDYIYAARGTYIELDEKLNPLNERSEKVWERASGAYDELISQMQILFGIFE